jgi:hypothetical protein
VRRPTPITDLYDWHSRALRGLASVHDSTPHCGWFKRRLVKGGVFVPARIWMAQDICPETGELLSDEILLCEVNSAYADPEEAWSWICSNPITEQEFRYLTARIDHAIRHEPEDSYADPRKPIEINRTPILF